jgi:hypothetical protein
MSRNVAAEEQAAGDAAIRGNGPRDVHPLARRDDDPQAGG